MTIDPDSNVYVYVQLAAILREQIGSGKIPVHRAIPSRKTLQQRYGVAAGTVEKALALLKTEGRLEMVRGRGLYVTERSKWRV
jgi:DNA-binding GntR family transcriptional regulator